MLWLWIVGGLVVWLVLATLLALVVGRGIRLADRSTEAGRPTPTAADLAPTSVAAAASPAPRARRRAVPLPPVGIALAGLAVALMAAGYALRLAGATGPTAQLLSMDGASSLPRLYVTALFGAAALAAVAGAGRIPGRRTWWLAVALIAGGIAAVKAGGSAHSRALNTLEGAVGSSVATALSALAAVVVVSSLWFLSRHERRDRRRVVGTLALYAGASVVLSAVSSVAGDLRATATFLEESGEALAGVAFLMAVLIGVAPRLVLPADWAPRRSGDVHTLELPQVQPGRAIDGTIRG